jgi:hypothetical protein
LKLVDIPLRQLDRVAAGGKPTAESKQHGVVDVVPRGHRHDENELGEPVVTDDKRDFMNRIQGRAGVSELDIELYAAE